ncbi:cytidylate kinase-like family protein [Sunxiuqinia sp. A32]|uniref:cytidylate kinase-like family protein n=1 Tax=Sunxiuqinia sp. A32 TaxID=3461496 RepID=UPI004045E79B
MKNLLKSYIEEAEKSRKRSKYPGPVVMISRECGCSAKRIATKLSKILSGYSYNSDTKTDVEWKWVSKEIIEETAHELELNPERIKNVFLSEVKSSLHDVSTAFSTDKVYDADDQEIIDTVKEVIYRIAEEGYYIIVGRASGAIAKDIPLKLSVKLQAPLEWRINRIMQISDMSKADAQEYVLEIDRQRDLFVEHVAGRKLNNNDYDLIFNYSTMQDDYIVDAIVNIMRNKKMITLEED